MYTQPYIYIYIFPRVEQITLVVGLVEQITLVVGLLGSIEESRWRQSLESFGMTKFQDGQPPGHVALMLEAPGEEAVSFLITPGERVFCLLVLNLVSSTLSCIRQTRQQLRVLDVCGFV